MALSLFESIHANPWSETFLDLPSLNAAASDAIEAAIRDTRTTARSRPAELRSACLTVLGPAGAGKTHLFGRLRRHQGPRAVFVHIRPLLGVEMTHRFVLHEIVRQLGFATVGLRQVDALVGSLLAHQRGGSSLFPQFFVEDYTHLESSVQAERLEAAVERVLSTWQELDESYLRRLLLVPFRKSPIDRALLAWLSGRELDPVQLERVGSSGALPEEAVLPGLKTLVAVASIGAPIVVVFDQLENLIDRELASSRLLAYAQLTTDLVDSVPGLVIVQMALDTEWTHGLLPSFNLAQRSRLTMQSHVLGLPTPREKEELLRLWLDQLPHRGAPFPWPLGEARVAELCGQPGMTPRMLLIALREMLNEAPVAVAMSSAERLPTPDAAAEVAASASGGASVDAEVAASASGGASVDAEAGASPSVDAEAGASPSVDAEAGASPSVDAEAGASASGGALTEAGASASGGALVEAAVSAPEGKGEARPRTAHERGNGVVPNGFAALATSQPAHAGQLVPLPERTAIETGVAEGEEADLLDLADEQVRREESLELAWEDHLAKARDLLDEVAGQGRSTEPVRLIDGVLAALRFVPSLRPVDVRAARPAQIRLMRGASEVHVALLHQAHFRSIGLALTKLCELAQSQEVVAIREQAQALPPTWVDTLARLDVFMARPKAHWVWLAREQTARLLALDDLLKSARSRDVTDHRGRGVEEAFVLEWAGRTLGIAQWPLFAVLLGESAGDSPGSATFPSETRLRAALPSVILPSATDTPPSVAPPAPTSAEMRPPDASASPRPPDASASPRPPDASASPRPPTASASPRPPNVSPPTAGTTPRPPVVGVPPRPSPSVPAARTPPRGDVWSTEPRTGSSPRLDAPARPAAASAAADPSVGPVLTVLTRLRLVSLDRLLREVSRVNRASTRTSVMRELTSLAPRVRWIGRSIVFLREEP